MTNEQGSGGSTQNQHNMETVTFETEKGQIICLMKDGEIAAILTEEGLRTTPVPGKPTTKELLIGAVGNVLGQAAAATVKLPTG